MKYQNIFFICFTFIIISCSSEIDKPIYSKEVNIEKRQFIVGNFQPITACEASSLTYYFEDCFIGTGYEEGIPAGMELFNDLDLSIFFTQVDNREDAHIVFNCVDDDKICGVSESTYPSWDDEASSQTIFPSGGTVGTDIFIENNWTECPCTEEELDLCFFMHSVANAVGKNLGVYQNAIELFGGPSSSPVHVEGTTDWVYDEGSMFNDGGFEAQLGFWCDRVCEFNPSDILALTALYPEERIDGPYLLCIDETYDYCLLEGSVGSWIKKGTDPGTGEVLPTRCSSYTFSDPGIYTISVETCGTTVTKEVKVESPCKPPKFPPAIFKQLCAGKSVCFDFRDPTFLESVQINSSSPNLSVSINGSTMCLSLLSQTQEIIHLELTTNCHCGGASTIWNLSANDPVFCD